MTSTLVPSPLSMLEFFDKEGERIPFEKWMELFEDDEYKQVSYYSNYAGDFTVSTVWTGLAKGFGPNGPTIFETRVIVPGEDPEFYSYSTLAEALRSHERLCDVTDDNDPTRMSSVLQEDEQ